MRRGRALVLTGSLAALATCGDEPQDRRDAQPRIRIANPYHDGLVALPPDLQRLGLMRAIRDNGRRCRRVAAARFQQDYRDMRMWVALCDDGRHWSIFIAANGDTQVRPCTDHAQLDLPVCRPLQAAATSEAPKAAPARRQP